MATHIGVKYFQQDTLAIQKELAMYSYHSNPAAEADAAVREELERRRTAALVEEKLTLIEQYDKDTLENGTVLKFSKRFEEGKMLYTYAALKINDQWYCTGSILGFTRGNWNEFVLALVGGTFPVSAEEVVVCTENTSLSYVANAIGTSNKDFFKDPSANDKYLD